MTVIRRVPLLLAAAAALLLASCRQRQGPDSLLLVTIDTLRADHVSCYGGPPGITPVLDRIAELGVRVDRAWTSVPLTTPAHATILTGLYPPTHGVRNNARFRLPEDVPTLAEILAREGRATGAVVGSFTTSRPFGLDRGFAFYDDDFGTSPAGTAYSARPGNLVVDRAIAWLERVPPDQPFFLWVHLFDPHTPYEPPPALAARFPGRPYAGEVAFSDAQVGRLLQALDRLGRARRTAVAALSDHGEGLGDHGEPEHGYLLYEETLHVPFLFAAPGVVPPGTVVPGPAGTIDLLPTILPLLGIEPPAGLPGRNLLAGAGPAGREIYAETLHPFEEFGWSALYALRRDDLKVLEAPRVELYDLAADPRETRDLAPARPEQASEMTAALRRLAPGLVNAERLARAVGGVSVEIDPEAIAKLESLGYVGGGGGVGAGEAASLPAVAGRNPVDAMGDLARFDRAQDALGAGRFDEATALLEDLRRTDPGNPQVLLKLAASHARAGRAVAAEEAYWDLVRRHPTFYLGYRAFSDWLEDAGRPREARDLWLRLRGLLPGYVGMEVRIARAELLAGLPAEAAGRMEAYLKDQAWDPEGWSLLGRARAALGRTEDALEAYRHALGIRPTESAALDGAVALLASSGRGEEARRLVRELLPRAPGDPALQRALAAAESAP